MLAQNTAQVLLQANALRTALNEQRHHILDQVAPGFEAGLQDPANFQHTKVAVQQCLVRIGDLVEMVTALEAAMTRFSMSLKAPWNSTDLEVPDPAQVSSPPDVFSKIARGSSQERNDALVDVIDWVLGRVELIATSVRQMSEDEDVSSSFRPLV